ncbi:MFS transporter [Phytoactinopolyspora limicola]|uniref:MFS transporter n=1 Tax=Phytoactinopolyspora limicola TaxID=2715536 RepID=UPI00140A8553|nr:MFS transporter [Phytoactinopolyspora limicola]
MTFSAGPHERVETLTPEVQISAPPTKVIITVGIGLVLPALPAFLVGATAAQVRLDVGLSETALGAMVAVLFVASALSAPLTGRLADRRGARFTITVGTVLSFAALSGIGLYVRNWLELAILMACAGVGLAFVDPGLNRLVASWVPDRRKGVVFGIKEASIPLATMAAGFAVPAIAMTAGWRWAFAVGVIPFVAVMLLLAAGGAGPWRPQPDSPSSQSGIDGSTAQPAGLRASSPTVLLLAVGAALASMAATGISVFLTDSAVAIGMSQAHGGILLGVASIAGVVVRIGSGALADRRPGAAGRLMPWMLAIGSVTMLLGATGTALLFGLGTVGALAGGWGWTALFFLTLVRSAPGRPGAVAGVGLSGLTAGNALGPIVFGSVAQSVSFSAAWLLAAVATGLAAATIWCGCRLLAKATRTTGVATRRTEVEPPRG